MRIPARTEPRRVAGDSIGPATWPGEITIH